MRKKITAIVLRFIFVFQTTQIVGATEISVDDGILNEVQMEDINPENVEEENCKEENSVKVGDNITATLEGTVLTLHGDGSTYNNEVIGSAECGKNKLFENLDYTNINEIKFEGNIKYIGNYFFFGFNSLREICFPEGMESLGRNSLLLCDNLEKISFPSSLKVIPAFRIGNEVECYPSRKLKEILIPDGVKEISDWAFAACENIENITLPDSIEKIGEYAFFDCDSLLSINLSDSITEIGMGIFSNCKSLQLICIPNTIKVIPSDAFLGCINLSDINIPESVERIEGSAFSNTALEKFTWPKNVSKIPVSVLAECDKLEEVIVPSTVTEIDAQAFRACSSLKKIVIPRSVEFLGMDVFWQSRNVIIYGNSDSKAEAYAYSNNVPFVSMDYRVVFKDNGRTIKTEYVLPGENATPPQLTKDGYKLSWYGDYTNVQEDMVIYAIWTKENENHGGTVIVVTPTPDKKYTVTFKDRDRIIKTEKVLSGEAADYPCIQRFGYELSWDKDFSKVTEDMTVNAVWTILKPEKVSNVTASIVSKKIQLTWDETDYAGYYKIYRKKSSENKFVLLDQTTKTLFKDTTAKENTEYQYKIVAVRSAEGKMYAGQESVIVTAKVKIPIIGKTYSVEGIKYKVGKSHSVAVQGLADALNEIHIPGTVQIFGETFKVKSIDHKAFYKNPDITSVTIGNNVTYIGKYSFYGCDSLKKVMFGNNVTTISTRAFTGCKNLGNVTLPSKLKVLGAEVFYKCPKVKQVVIKSGYLNYVGKKGLMMEKNAVIKVPEKMYASYVKIIEASGKYSETKIKII